jgi:hypothetical protein
MHYCSHKANRHQYTLFHRSLSAKLSSVDNMDVHRAHLLVFEQIKEADITNLQVIVLDKLSPSMYKRPALAGRSTKPHFPPLVVPLKNDFLLLLCRQVRISIYFQEFLLQFGNKYKLLQNYPQK